MEKVEKHNYDRSAGNLRTTPKFPGRRIQRAMLELVCCSDDSQQGGYSRPRVQD